MGSAIYTWLLDRGFDIAYSLISLFPETGPFVDGVGLPLAGFNWAFPVVATLIDFPELAAMLSFAVTTEVLILQISFLRWLWGWVKW